METVKFLEEEKQYLTELIIEYVSKDYNPQKLIDKKNYIDSLIKKAIKTEEDSINVEFDKSNLSVINPETM